MGGHNGVSHQNLHISEKILSNVHVDAVFAMAQFSRDGRNSLECTPVYMLCTRTITFLLFCHSSKHCNFLATTDMSSACSKIQK